MRAQTAADDPKTVMSKPLKKLLWWSAGLMIMALIVQRIQMEHRLTLVVGLVEMVLAVATGIALGLAAAKNEHGR